MDPADPGGPGSHRADGPEPGDVPPADAAPDAGTGGEEGGGTGDTAPADGAVADTRTEPAGTEPAGTEPAGTEPAGTEPAGTEPAGDAPAAAGAPAEGAPPRRGRRKKILAWTGGTLAVILVISLAGAYLLYRHLNGNLRQVNVSGELGHRPADLHPKAENILVIGSDTRKGQSRRYGSGAVLSTDQSDTLMVVHVAANRKWADIMSIPRDSWVNIPACQMGNGKMSGRTTFKINEAFAIGNLHGNHTDLGVACTIRTVEKNTGILINHFVAVNFAGFKAMVNAVGGVPECNTRAINDPESGLHLRAGHHVLNGSQALGYVRARYSIGNGSDLERISRQQAFMSSLVDRVKSKLLNPLAVYRFLDAATKSITVDSQLGGIHGLYNLAMSVKNLPPGNVTFFTLPTYPRMFVDPGDTADVMWTQPQDSLIFQAFRNDVPVSKKLLKNPRTPQVPPHTVKVRVLDGTGSGLQYAAAASLEQEGFRVTSTGVAATQSVTETVIRYHAGQQRKALLLAKKVHGAALRQVPGAGRLILMLGSNYGSTAHTGPGPGTTPQPSSSFAPRTATQNICT